MDTASRPPYLTPPEAWLVSDFVRVCPVKGYPTPHPCEIVREMPPLRKLVEANPALLKENVRQVIKQMIVDMAMDEFFLEKFVEFGVFVLDRCAIEGCTQFLDRFNEETYVNFVQHEFVNYVVVGREHATELLGRGTAKVWCSNGNCPKEGNFFCGRCQRKLNLRVFYCSRECQVEHYPLHRRYCGKEICDSCKAEDDDWDDYLERIETKYMNKTCVNRKSTKEAATQCHTKSADGGDETREGLVGTADQSRWGVERGAQCMKALKRGFFK